MNKVEYLRGGAGWALAVGVPVGAAGLIAAITFTLAWSVPAMGALTPYWVKAPFTLALSVTGMITAAILIALASANISKARTLELDAAIFGARDSGGIIAESAAVAEAASPPERVRARIAELLDMGVIEAIGEGKYRIGSR